MADNETPEDVVEDVEWLVDEDGVEYFLEDGVRYELADDGYAYPVEVDEDEEAEDEEPDAAAETKPFQPPASAAASAASSKTASAKSKGDQVDWPKQTAAASVTERPAAAPASNGAGSGGVGKDVLLKLDGVKSGYGSLPVLHGVSTEIRVGETAVMLGLNGAGKTTTALNVCGALKTWGGTITYDGQDSTNWDLKTCVKNGIIMCPEGRRVFPELSVAKNLQIGSWMQRKEKSWIKSQRDRVFDYFPRLRQRTAQLAGSLSGGEQQMLAVGRALMANPRLLIIDEASMGLAPVIVKDVFNIIADINRDGVTVLLIEQNVGALEVADLGLVMEQGRMVKELRGERLRDRSEVTEVLMGSGDH